MKRWLVRIGVVLAMVVVGLLVAAWMWRPAPVEPFVPTDEEAAQLALYQQPEAWFLDRLEKPVEIDGQRLDPKFQYMFEQAGDTSRAAPMMETMFRTAPGRRFIRAAGDRHWILFSKETAPMEKVEDREVEGRGGAIPVRIYWPEVEAPGPLPMLVYAHGGGYLFGSIASFDRAVRLMANEAQVIVVSINYRLAPEHPYPAASEDGEDVFLWARANAAALGGDPERVAFGGDSAGGHIALNVTQRQLDRDQTPPTMLLLYYPAPGAPHDDPSFELFGHGFGLDAPFFDYLLTQVFPGRTLEDERDAYMEPLRAETFQGFPPTIVTTAGFDILRDSGRTLARRLEADGVPVATWHAPSLPHSFLHFTGVIEDADAAATETARWLGEGLRRLDAPFSSVEGVTDL